MKIHKGLYVYIMYINIMTYLLYNTNIIGA